MRAGAHHKKEADVVLPRLHQEAEEGSDEADHGRKGVLIHMTYQREHYKAVFDAMRKTYGEDWYNSVNWPVWGVIWRRQIKSMFFEEDILISEMVSAMREAADKNQWPSSTAYFVRLRDVVLKNRREVVNRVRISGPEGISAILKSRGM